MDSIDEIKEELIEESSNKKRIIKIVLTILFIILITVFYARFLGTKGLVVKEYAIKTTHLDEYYDGFKIVHFSDLHYGSTIFIDDVKKLVKKINSEEPHVVVFTGDLIDKDFKLSENDATSLRGELSKINPDIEVLAVKGNHDYEHDYFNSLIDELGWHYLDNTYEYLYHESKKPIIFVGLDDLLKGTPDYQNAFSYLNEIGSNHYTIVLAHEPDQIKEINNYDFNLYLAGHSHLGQVRLPLIGAIYTPVGSKKYYDEHYKVSNADLYINGCIGTSSIKFRLFNKPSINLYRFYTK